MAMNPVNGKGAARRPEDSISYRDNHSKIFGMSPLEKRALEERRKAEKYNKAFSDGLNGLSASDLYFDDNAK